MDNTGLSNRAWYDAISGGFDNSNHGILACYIGGGFNNKIGDSLQYAVIAGGSTNTIDAQTGSYSIIGGGVSNTIVPEYAAIAGGILNTIDTFADHSFIGGGLQNLIEGPFCVIAGGDSNSINTATSDHNTIGGGEGNVENNPSLGVIAGGWQNLLDTNAWASAICGGWNNVVESALSFIGGGWGNKILDYGWPYDGVLVGGRSNQMVGSPEAFIGSGDSNYVQGIRSALVGGDSNTVTAAYAFLGGGVHNKLDWGSDTSVISGGAYNYVGSRWSAIGGGRFNHIDSTGQNANIPGGDSLVANSYAETVIGYNNVTGTAVTKAQAVAGVAGLTLDAALFAIGNGTSAGAPHNAMTVSYDGHSTVFDVNNNGIGGRPAILGSTYQDNIVYAWGDITGTTGIGLCVGSVAETADFGVQGLAYICTGHYRVTLSTHDNTGNLITGWSDLSVTATPMTLTASTPATCVIAVVTPVLGTSFDIFLFDPGSSCTPVDGRVSFHVCGRH